MAGIPAMDRRSCNPRWGVPDPRSFRRVPLTFALQALAEKTLEQLLASLANGGPSVAMYKEGVRHLDLGHQHLVQLNGSACVEGGGRGGGRRRGWAAREEVCGAAALPGGGGGGGGGVEEQISMLAPTGRGWGVGGRHQPSASSPPPTLLPLTSSSAVQGKDSELPRRTE